MWITHSKIFFTIPYEAVLLCYFEISHRNVLQLFVLGSVFVEAVTHVMLMHVCNDNIKPFRRYVFVLASHCIIFIFSVDMLVVVDYGYQCGLYG